MTNSLKFKWLALVSVALMGCGSAEKTEEAKSVEPTGYGAVWSEFLSAPELEAAVPTLAEHGLSLNLAWPASSVADPERLAFVRQARASGVEVRPWILLEDSDGYWPGSTNASAFASAALDLLDAWAAADLPPTTLIVDMEMRKDRAFEMDAMLNNDSPDLAGFVKFLHEARDENQYAAATGKYQELVTTAHERGWKVHVTTLPQVLDDYADGDDDIRQTFGIPLDLIDWDVITFQAYRTLFGGLLSKGQIPTSYFVFAYGVDARARFGSRAGVDIGMVGKGVSDSPVYADGSELSADVAAAFASGVPANQTFVYNLDGIVARAPLAQWLGRAPQDAIEPEPDALTASIRKQSQLLDAILDP